MVKFSTGDRVQVVKQGLKTTAKCGKVVGSSWGEPVVELDNKITLVYNKQSLKKLNKEEDDTQQPKDDFYIMVYDACDSYPDLDFSDKSSKNSTRIHNEMEDVDLSCGNRETITETIEEHLENWQYVFGFINNQPFIAEKPKAVIHGFKFAD